MTKNQSVWFLALGIIYSVLVSSLGGPLAHTLGLASLSYVFWVLVTTERNGYAK